MSAIDVKYNELGGPSGFLGTPTTNELVCPAGIYWKPFISAHEIYGLIRQYWADHGWEKKS